MREQNICYSFFFLLDFPLFYLNNLVESLHHNIFIQFLKVIMEEFPLECQKMMEIP